MNKILARAVTLFLLISFVLFSLFSFSSCEKKPSSYELMNEFCASYGIEDTVFSSEVEIGETGYANENFFENVFGEKPECVSDYAVVFLSSLDKVGECVLLRCYSDYDALVACDMLLRRLDLLKSMGTGMDTSYVSDAVVFKSGKYAVMCALSDNERARTLWRKIL